MAWLTRYTPTLEVWRVLYNNVVETCSNNERQGWICGMNEPASISSQLFQRLSTLYRSGSWRSTSDRVRDNAVQPERNVLRNTANSLCVCLGVSE
jgi:hypothetical protein